MSRVVWLNDGFVAAEAAALSIDDPGVRYGEGLFETMRAHRGRLPLIESHLARLAASIDALGLAPMASIGDVRAAAIAAAARIGDEDGRVRVTVTPHPTLLVEAEPVVIDPQLSLAAAEVRGAWVPGRRIAQHKTLSFLGWRDAQRRAERAGGEIALLSDSGGALGEASTANVFAVVDGELLTPPVDGILPGVVRATVLRLTGAREAQLPPDAWRKASELFLTSAVRGVTPVRTVDGRPAGDLRRPVTEDVRAIVDQVMADA